MTRWRGNAAARGAFRAAMSGGALHHAWLFAGPEGVGKAAFAREAAARLLAEAAGERGPGDFALSPESRTGAMMGAGAHPDFRELRRLPKDPDKPTELARSIPIAQVRGLLPMFATAPAIAARRVVMIDAIDDVERPGASNALLKSLEEPPAGTIFLLISHAPGRLLPTIRSRCRLLRFEPLDPGEMRAALGDALPEASPGELDALVRIGGGAPGRALRYAGLDIGGIDDALAAIARDGDPGNGHRLKLSRALTGKSSQPRYEAFLERAPSFIAEAAPLRHGRDLQLALDTYAEARDLAAFARAHSLEPGGTVLEMTGLVARLHARGAMH